MLAGEKEVPKKKYPPEVNKSTVLKGMAHESLVDVGFHTLMAILLITGLIIDLLGPWLGGWLASIRSIAHGYIGAIFVLVFIVYIIKIAISKKMRTVLTATNYIDFLLYIILIITGITIASPNKPWIDLVPDRPCSWTFQCAFSNSTICSNDTCNNNLCLDSLCHSISRRYLARACKRIYHFTS